MVRKNKNKCFESEYSEFLMSLSRITADENRELLQERPIQKWQSPGKRKMKRLK